jgi:hypothetical protein
VPENPTVPSFVEPVRSRRRERVLRDPPGRYTEVALNRMGENMDGIQERAEAVAAQQASPVLRYSRLSWETRPSARPSGESYGDSLGRCTVQSQIVALK